MVDHVVDEGVQIFGGYGFHEDYPVARAYRDSRVNRIFEGTNEINRMLIIQMLMKRALGGVLPLIPAAMKLGEEVLAGPSFEEAPTGPFAEEEKSLEQAKKIFLLTSGSAMQKFREQLAEQQEIVASLANIVMDVYAMESTLRRAQKASAARGEAASVMCDAARAFITTRWTASKRMPVPRSPPSLKATRSSPSSPCCAASRNTRQSTQSPSVAASPKPCSRKIAIHSKIANRRNLWTPSGGSVSFRYLTHQ
jgi:hypothetical protein